MPPITPEPRIISQNWCKWIPNADRIIPPHQHRADTNTRLARTGALEPTTPQRCRAAEKDEEQRVHPAERGDAPVTASGEQFGEEAHVLRAGLGAGACGRERLRQRE